MGYFVCREGEFMRECGVFNRKGRKEGARRTEKTRTTLSDGGG